MSVNYAENMRLAESVIFTEFENLDSRLSEGLLYCKGLLDNVLHSNDSMEQVFDILKQCEHSYKNYRPVSDEQARGSSLYAFVQLFKVLAQIKADTLQLEDIDYIELKQLFVRAFKHEENHFYAFACYKFMEFYRLNKHYGIVKVFFLLYKDKRESSKPEEDASKKRTEFVLNLEIDHEMILCLADIFDDSIKMNEQIEQESEYEIKCQKILQECLQPGTDLESIPSKLVKNFDESQKLAQFVNRFCKASDENINQWKSNHPSIWVGGGLALEDSFVRANRFMNGFVYLQSSKFHEDDTIACGLLKKSIDIFSELFAEMERKGSAHEEM